MATQVPPKKGVAYTFTTSLTSQANAKIFQSNPTLATGDVKVRTDSGSLANITTLPTVVGSSKLIDVSLSASEMNGDRIQVLFSDAAGSEWCDLFCEIDTTARQVDDLSTVTTAQVNAEVVDALATDTYAEPGKGAPAATTSLAAKINYLFKAWRNKKTQTATQFSLYDDAGTTVDQEATVSDSNGTTTVGEIASGP